VAQATPDQLAAISEAAARLMEAEDADEIQRLHTEFHDSIAAASGNELLVFIHRTVEQATAPMLHGFFRSKTAVDGMKELHLRLAAAITSRELVLARQIGDEHLARFRKQYERLMGGSESGTLRSTT
jgi:DNA-binding FadR family transcriptional regulator